MKKASNLLLAALFALCSVAGPAAADVAKGEKNYKRCVACHSLKEGKNGVGPSLYKIFGKKAAANPKFKYSKGLKAASEKGLVWNRENLMGYLKHPRKFLKKYLDAKSVSNKMNNRFKKEAFRKDLIDFLEAEAKK